MKLRTLVSPLTEPRTLVCALTSLVHVSSGAGGPWSGSPPAAATAASDLVCIVAGLGSLAFLQFLPWCRNRRCARGVI